MALEESNLYNLSNWETKIILLISIFPLLKDIEVSVGTTFNNFQGLPVYFYTFLSPLSLLYFHVL